MISTPQQLASGQWGAVPSTTTPDFGTPGVQQLYITVANTGTLALTGTTYTVSGTNFKRNTTLSLVACVGGSWVVSTGACTGGVMQTVASSTGTATTTTASSPGTFPALVGSTVTLMAQLNKTPNKTTLGSVSVTVDRSEIRAAAVVHA
jgi:hypothetical protein